MGTVTLYSTGCPKCEILKKKLSEKKISFNENNDIEEMQQLGMLSAPALAIDDNIMDFMAAIEWVKGQ